MRLIIFFIFIANNLVSSIPDTTKLPEKWKHESIIVLDHVYRAEESNFDDARYSESIKIVYYIRDKFGLQQLSTLNIPTYIVPGAEMQIGKIYKKNKDVIDLTSKYLIPTFTKIDFGNNRKNRSTRFRDDGQKLAIPSLEVGDILEIEYTTKRKEAIGYLDLSVAYPTLHSELSVSVLGDNYGVASIIQFKPINFPLSNVESTPFTVKVERKQVDKILDYPLSDENRNVPYVLIWKKRLNNNESSTFNSSKDNKYAQMTGEELKQEQLKFITYIYQEEAFQTFYANNLLSVIDKKYDQITDTVKFLNDLFYYYREYLAKKSLTESNPIKNIQTKDVFFVNVLSRILTDKKIPYKVFISQADYYGVPESEKDLINIRYGFVFPHLQYYLFNPYFYSFPNKIPSYYEDQSYMFFKASPAYFPSGCSKKTCTYGFEFATFPHSSPEENLTQSDIIITNFDLNALTCKLQATNSYFGKNKNRITRNICSATYLYEKEQNEYRSALIQKKLFDQASFAQLEKHNKFLKKYLLDDVQEDGYDTDDLLAYNVEATNFFSTNEPIITQTKFKLKNYFSSFDEYLVFNIGRLLGNQLNYTEKEVPRQNNFYIPFKKKYIFNIQFEIPSGYRIENLADLNSKIETTAGKFESKARLEGNRLIINTEKLYRFIDYDKKDEKDISVFLNLATDFTQKKLVLKKT
jgi:hypothetical protein